MAAFWSSVFLSATNAPLLLRYKCHKLIRSASPPAPARSLFRSFAHRALLAHSLTHSPCLHTLHYPPPRRAARGPPSLPFMEAQKEEEKRRVAICWLFREFNVESKPSIGQRPRGSPFSSLLGSGMAAIRPSSRPAMGGQWHVPTTNSTPPSSFALFAECARARRTTVLFMCAAWGYCLSKVHRPRDAAKRLLKSAADSP